MEIWEADKILIFIAFVIPGFVSLKVFSLIYPGTSKDSDKLLIDAIAYSSVNYALLLLPIYYVEKYGVQISHPFLYVFFYVFVLLIAPVIWAFSSQFIRTREWAQNFFPHPTSKPWDYVFSQRKECWIIVTLNNGEKIGGLYRSGSFASSAPAVEQIFLEKHWVLTADGNFERERKRTAGILILSSEISTVELIKLTEEVVNEQ